MATGEQGSSGLAVFGGRIANTEPNRTIADRGLGDVTRVGIWEEMRLTDPICGAVLMAAEDVILGLDYKVQGDEGVDQRAIDLVRRAFDEIQDGWHGTLRRILRHLQDGYALAEVVYRKAADGAILWQRWAPRPPRTIWAWNIGDGDRIDSVTQFCYTAASTCRQIELKTSEVDLIHFAHRADTGNPQGVSLLRPAYGFWQLKVDQLKLRKVALARFGTGFIDIVAPPGGWAGDKDVDALETTAKKWANGERTFIIRPDGSQFKVIFPTGSLPDITPDLNYLDRQILMVILGQFMALGTADTGSRSVGEVQDDVHLRALQSVVNYVEDVINGRGWPGTCSPIRKLVDLNLGPQKVYPRLELGNLRSMDPGAFFSIINEAVGKSLRAWTLDDENACRDRLGLSPVTEEDVEAGKPAPAVPPAPPAPPAPDATSTDDDGTNADPDAPDDDKAPEKDDVTTAADRPGCDCRALKEARPQVLTIDCTGKPFLSWREPQGMENVIALADTVDGLNGAVKGFPGLVRPIQEAQAKAFEEAVKEALAKGGDITAIQKRIARLGLTGSGDLQKAIAGYVREYAATFYGLAETEIHKAIAQGLGLDKIPPGVQGKNPATVLNQVKDLDAYSAEVGRSLGERLDSELLGSLKRTAARVAATGVGLEAVSAVPVVKSEGSYKSVWGQAGTSVMSAARDRAARDVAADTETQIRYCVYVSLLDQNTCDPCAARDSREFEFGSDDYYEWWPGANDCDGAELCRCIYAYVLGGPDA